MRRSLSAVVTVGLLGALFAASSLTAASSIPPARGLRVKTFIPLTKRALQNGSISFTRLSSEESQEVRLPPQLALQDLMGQFTMPEGSRVYSISLGGYVNKLDIVHDWVGTKSKWPKRVATYMVTIRGLNIRSEGPTQSNGVNHEEIFIVNATTGKVKSSFSYR